MAKIIKMMDLLKKEGIELGKVYTDKDNPPFKIAEMKVNNSKVTKAYNGVLNHMRKEIKKLNDDEMYEMTKKLKLWFKKNIYEDVNEDFGSSIKQLPTFSSKEAKKVVDDGLRVWAKDLRKVQYRVIKDWMSKAKSGTIDYFDVVRGIQVGDISRAHPYETKFFKAMLDKDKILDRFRKYIGGKKGKPGYRGPR